MRRPLATRRAHDPCTARLPRAWLPCPRLGRACLIWAWGGALTLVAPAAAQAMAPVPTTDATRPAQAVVPSSRSSPASSPASPASPARSAAPSPARSPALTALYEGDYARAHALATARLRVQPRDAEALVVRARADMALERHDAAFDGLRQALAIDPAHVDALYFLGLLAERRAHDEYRRLFALAPGSARVHQLLAESLQAQEDAAGADAEFTAALKADPSAIEALVGLATLKRYQSRFDEALTLYQRAHAIRPTFDSAYGLGVCHVYRAERTEAIARFREALRFDPRSAVAQFALGSALVEAGEAAEALEPLQQAIALEPRMRQAHYVLGRVLRTLGRQAEADAALKTAERLAQEEADRGRPANTPPPPSPTVPSSTPPSSALPSSMPGPLH